LIFRSFSTKPPGPLGGFSLAVRPAIDLRLYRSKGSADVIGDIERLILVQHQVIKLRRLAAQIPDREISMDLHSLADKIEQRSREADRRLCSPN
jgi:hypothetical protein